MSLSKIQKKPGVLKSKRLALQNMKFIKFFYFCRSFLPSWIQIRIQPTKINADPDPKVPKHWIKVVRPPLLKYDNSNIPPDDNARAEAPVTEV